MVSLKRATDNCGGDDIMEFTVSPLGETTIDLRDINFSLGANETLSVEAKVVSGSNAEVTATIMWQDDF